MTDKSLSQLRRAVLTRVNLGKRVSPTMLKELLGAEWKEQEELKTSLAETVANLQAVEEDKDRERFEAREEIFCLHNKIADEITRSNFLLSNLEAVEEDRIRKELSCDCKADTAASEALDDWEDLAPFGPEPKEAPPFKEAVFLLISAVAVLAALIYFS